MASLAFLGIGTGRCGTVSLSHIVAACENTHVTHENPAVRSPWAKLEDAPTQALVDHVRWAQANGITAGDVALYWLPHVQAVREVIPGLKVICLRREREATIASLERKCPGYTLLRPEDRPHNPEWWDLMPSIEAPTIAEAWARYYDEYYEQAALLPDVLHVRTESLADDATLTRIFDYLEIPEADRRYSAERRLNTGGKTVVARSRLHG